MQVQIINQSSGVTAEQLAQIVPALQEQVVRDFAPLWGVTATLTVGAEPVEGAYTIILQDHVAIQGDLGYHVDQNGIPTAYVGVLDATQDGDTASSVISHELLEMLADPTANRMRGEYIVEVCDPVESNMYPINNVLVSNFVTPRYFGFSQVGQFDQLNYLKAGVPEMTGGGYVMYFNGTSWVSSMARRADGMLSRHAVSSARSLFRAKNPISLSKQYLDD